MSLLDRRSFLTTTAAGLAALPSARGMTLPAEEDPLGVRADFPITRNLTFLATSWIGPMPRVVRDVAVEYVDEKMYWADSRLRLEKKEMTRTAFAELFGAKPEEVALLSGTGDAENIVTRGLDLKAGDNVVIDDLHFTSSIVLYRHLEKDKGVELRVVPEKNGRSPLEEFEARIDEKTRLVSVAWVSNRNGYRHDLRALTELAHANGALVFTDAVQAIGTFPANLNELGVDFLVAGAYKGCSPTLEWRRFSSVRSTSIAFPPTATATLGRGDAHGRWLVRLTPGGASPRARLPPQDQRN